MWIATYCLEGMAQRLKKITDYTATWGFISLSSPVNQLVVCSFFFAHTLFLWPLHVFWTVINSSAIWQSCTVRLAEFRIVSSPLSLYFMRMGVGVSLSVISYNYFSISVCEYYVHVDCQDLAVSDCKEAATYVPNLDKVIICFYTSSKFWFRPTKLHQRISYFHR